jgi:hypothetical protein
MPDGSVPRLVACEVGDLRLRAFPRPARACSSSRDLRGSLVWRLTRATRTGLLAVAAFATVYAAVTLTALVAALGGRPLLG